MDLHFPLSNPPRSGRRSGDLRILVQTVLLLGCMGVPLAAQDEAPQLRAQDLWTEGTVEGTIGGIGLATGVVWVEPDAWDGPGISPGRPAVEVSGKLRLSPWLCAASVLRITPGEGRELQVGTVWGF